jgi:hypothetical protein
MNNGAMLISAYTFVQLPQCPIANAQNAIDGDIAEKKRRMNNSATLISACTLLPAMSHS